MNLDARACWFAVLVLFVGFGIVSNNDYKDAKRQEAERHATKLIKECRAKGHGYLAQKADGRVTNVRCMS